MTFADRLNKQINLKGISGYRLSKEMKVSYSAVNSWLSGKAMPRENHLEKLADFFECDKTWLRYGKEAKITPEVMALARKIDRYVKKHPKELEKFRVIISALTK